MFDGRGTTLETVADLRFGGKMKKWKVISPTLKYPILPLVLLNDCRDFVGDLLVFETFKWASVVDLSMLREACICRG